MTVGATNAASGDGKKDASSVLAAMVMGNVEAARAYGLDAARLMADAGLEPSELADPDGRVALDKYLRFWEALSALPNAMDYALWLSAATRVELLGVVGYAMQHAADLRAAFACLERYGRLINDQLSPRIEEHGDQVSFRRVEPPRLARLLPLLVTAPDATLTLMRSLAGFPATMSLASEVALPHPRPAPALEARLRAVFDCPLVFHAPELRLTLPRALFDRPVVAPHPGLYAYLTRHASALQSRLNESHGFATRVRDEVLARLREGEPEQPPIARRLGVSERTLQRRLKEEGKTFAAVVDELRRELALLYLTDPELPIFQIAFLLGYSEPSAFQRAFRRWTGKTPREHRRGSSEGE